MKKHIKHSITMVLLFTIILSMFLIGDKTVTTKVNAANYAIYNYERKILNLEESYRNYYDEYSSYSYQFHLDYNSYIIVVFKDCSVGFDCGDNCGYSIYGEDFYCDSSPHAPDLNYGKYYVFEKFDQTHYNANEIFDINPWDNMMGEYAHLLPKGDYTISITRDGHHGYYNESFPAVDVFCRYLKPIKTKKVSINKKSIKTACDKDLELKYSFYPSNSTEKPKWKTSNSKIISYYRKERSSKIRVHTNSLGKATLTYQRGGKKATCKFIVNKVYINNERYFSLKKGKKKSLKSFVKNIKGYKKAKWKSSKKKIISVNKKGIIKRKRYGKATITAKIKGTKYKFYLDER